MKHDDHFLTLMTEFQGRLFAFVLSLLGDFDQANEVLQDTNLTLWTKADEFQPGSDFKAWSFRVAHFQVMAFRQRQMRDRLIFDNQALEKVYREASVADELIEQRQERLDRCLERLSVENQSLLSRFYTQGESLQEIALTVGKTANAVGQTLFRLRKSLIDCVSDERWGTNHV